MNDIRIDLLHDENMRNLIDLALVKAIQNSENGKIEFEYTEKREIDVRVVECYIDHLRTLDKIPTQLFLGIAAILRSCKVYLDEDAMEVLDYHWLAHKGMKTTRFVRKVLCKYYGDEFDIVRYCRFADALSPFEVQHHCEVTKGKRYVICDINAAINNADIHVYIDGRLDCGIALGGKYELTESNEIWK